MNIAHVTPPRPGVRVARRCAAVLLFATLATGRTDAQTTDPATLAVYRERCAQCHEGGEPRAPQRPAMKMLRPERVRSSMLSGSMVPHAQGLSVAQVDALARLLGGEATPEALAQRCAKPMPSLEGALERPHWIGWGNGPEQRRHQAAQHARLSAEDVPRLKLKWAFGFPGVSRAYGQPAVVGGVLFVGSAEGKVYALDAATGCQHWEYKARAPVRTAIAVGQVGGTWQLHFGDQRGHAYALSAAGGQERWVTATDEHRTALITGAPLLEGRRLFVPLASAEEAFAMNPKTPCCTFRGSLAALDAETGKLLWKTHTIAKEPAPTRKNDNDVQLYGPSGAAVWSSPTLDRRAGQIVVTTGNSYSDPPSDGANALVAFALDDGQRRWVRQLTEGDAYTMACNRNAPGVGNCPQAGGPDLDFGASAMLLSTATPGGATRLLVAGQKSGVVHAIDPDRQGAIVWQTRVGAGGRVGGVQWGTAADDRHIYAAVSDMAFEVVPAGTAGGQPTPFGATLRMKPDVGGGLVALRIADGQLAWRTPHPGCKGEPGCSPAQSAAVTSIPGVVLSGGLDGHLRAYDAATGRILWSVDTRQPYTTTNGVAAKGGSLDGPGPVVVDGMLYVNSGYAMFGGIPGNVLLAFSVEGR
jgi:polyvinyl alcohol dehydrogenase (cytochrome)